MKVVKITLVLLLSTGMIFTSGPKLLADETSDIILKLLVKKGIITQAEVNELRDEIKNVEEKKVITAERRPEDFRTYWKDGLRFKTDDGNFSLKVGGRIMADAGVVNGDSDIDAISGESDIDAEFRRARFYMSGTIYKDFIYKLQLDFAGGDADFRDAYLGMQNIPYLGTIKVGHFKEPFSLDELTSSKYITFIERALPNAFSPGRNIGVAFNNTAFNDRVTWGMGVFKDADDYGNVISNEYDFTTRFTALPWYKDGGRKLLHVGAAYSFRKSDDTLQYSESPEAHIEPSYVDTGIINAHLSNLAGYETALVYGPFSLQGEYMYTIINQTDGPSSTFLQGAYGQASYFLTGENRKYSKSTGAFSRVKPNNNFSLNDRTFGAWEIGARYSYIDLSDGDLDGRIMSNATAGLNWYLNPNMRLMGNYIHSHLNTYGDADIFLARFQVDF